MEAESAAMFTLYYCSEALMQCSTCQQQVFIFCRRFLYFTSIIALCLDWDFIIMGKGFMLFYVFYLGRIHL